MNPKRTDDITAVLDLSCRARSVCRGRGGERELLTLGDLTRCTWKELRGRRQCGDTTVCEYLVTLNAIGLRLGMTDADWAALEGEAVPTPTVPTTIPGMTLRDWFAGLALEGMIERQGADCDGYRELVTSNAYKAADAMMAAREKP